MVKALRIMVKALRIMAKALRIMVKALRNMVKALRIMVKGLLIMSASNKTDELVLQAIMTQNCNSRTGTVWERNVDILNFCMYLYRFFLYLSSIIHSFRW